jgi:DNA-binding beta-propeller fold protein YncE
MDRAPISVVPSPDGRFVYATSQFTEIEGMRGPGRVASLDVGLAEIDPNNCVLNRVPAGNAVRLALSMDGSIAWVTLRTENRLVAFDAASLREDPTCKPIASVPVGRAPVGVTPALDDRVVLVANSNRFDEPNAPQTVTLIDVRDVRQASLRPMGDVEVGVFPRELTRLPTGDCVLTNFGSGEVSILSALAIEQLLI